MYRLFTESKTASLLNKPQGFNRIKQYTDLIKDYKVGLQRTYGEYIPSDHLLVKLCYSLIPFLEIETDTYRIIFDNIFKIISPLKITSPYTAGKIHTCEFYTTDCIIYSGNFIRTFDKNWQTIKTIRCLEHPYHSMSFDIAPMKKQNCIDGLSGVFIDIPAFGVKFKKWYLQNKLRSAFEQESIIQYIERYIATELLESYLDICIRNRILYLAQNKKPPNDRPTQPFITALENDIDSELNKVIGTLRGYTKTPYSEILNAIPFLVSKSYYTAFPHEIGGLNNYTYAFQSLITINWIYPILYIVSDFKLQKTFSEISFILARAKRYRDTTKCMSNLPPHLKYDFFKKLSLVEGAFL